MYAKFIYKDWLDSKKGWTQLLLPEGATRNAVGRGGRLHHTALTLRAH